MLMVNERSTSSKHLQAAEQAKQAEQQRCSTAHAERSGVNDVERK